MSKSDKDPEVSALARIQRVLDDLDSEQRSRVVNYFASRYAPRCAVNVAQATEARCTITPGAISRTTLLRAEPQPEPPVQVEVRPLSESEE